MNWDRLRPGEKAHGIARLPPLGILPSKKRPPRVRNQAFDPVYTKTSFRPQFKPYKQHDGVELTLVFR